MFSDVFKNMISKENKSKKMHNNEIEFNKWIEIEMTSANID